MRHLSCATMLALGLTACTPSGNSDTVTTVDLEGTERPAFDPLPAGDRTPSPAPAASPATARPIAAIPPRFQGRWALVAADCERGRSDAKGLLTITGDTLRFYESRARPTRLVQTDAATVSGQYAFVGEGMEWERGVTLQLVDGGAGLIRSEEGVDALPEPLRYARCPA